MSRLALQNLGNAVGISLSEDEQLKYLDYFIESGLAACQMAVNVGKEIKIVFHKQEYIIIPEEKNYTVSDKSWIAGYLACIARRDMITRKAYCEIDLDMLENKSQTKGGQYSLYFAKFLQRLFLKAEPHGKNLLAAANEIKKDKMPEPTYEYALYNDGPLIDMYTPILMNDEKDFNAMLLNALELHKKYWQKEPADPLGLISLPITALTVMAKDYDFKIEHTSDYIVQSLVDN